MEFCDINCIMSLSNNEETIICTPIDECLQHKNEIHSKLKILEFEITKLHKKLLQIDKHMYNLCNHEWIIEPQIYATTEKKCKICNLYL